MSATGDTSGRGALEPLLTNFQQQLSMAAVHQADAQLEKEELDLQIQQLENR